MRYVFSFFLFIASILLNTSVYAITADLSALVKQNHQAIVNITTTYVETTASDVPHFDEIEPFYDFFRRYFDRDLPEQEAVPDMPRERRKAGNGSGFIVSADGYVLTNMHVVKEADEILVALSDRREFEAEVIGMDERSDVALLKIDAVNLPIVKLGDSDKLKVGQWVVAIGSPFGFDHSATQGIISALGRSLPDENYVPFIQTDVAVNPGNSGGPLFNLAGEVVGINSQIYSRSGGYMGLSFAIPINLATHVMEQLKTDGKVSRGWLGVLIQSVNSDLAQSFGLDKPDGALVAKVVPDSPAAEAGLEVGDIIVEYNDKHIYRHHDLPSLVGMTPAGSQADLKVLRQNKAIAIQVRIGELPDSASVSSTGGSKRSTANKNPLGLVVADLTEEDRKVTGVEHGVIVKRVNSGPASLSGVRQGDVILQLYHAEIKNVEQFEQVVADLPANKPVSMLIQRDNGAFFVTVEVEDK
jgi:serine protease Do